MRWPTPLLTLALFGQTLSLLAGPGPAPAAPVVIVGHKNPDTDSIVGALAVAHLKNKQGVPAVAVAQGPVNPETQYVLETYRLAAPPVETSVAGRKVVLIDHSDAAQAPADLAKAELIGLVDHHKLGGLATDKPLEAWIFPVGSANTIVLRMFRDAKVAVPKALAGAMLCAILSDTVMLKSPTTTPEDKAAVVQLSKLAGVKDPKALGMKLFEVKSQLKGASAAELLKRDFKAFDMAGRKVGVAQIEVVDLALLASFRVKLFEAMEALKAEGYHSLLLMQTDVIQEATDLLVVSEEPARIEAALKGTLKERALWMPGVMSRKKQVIPNLEKAFKQP